ncbi:MAG: 4-hydroxy-tetrahydrodipicolinate synthase [Deltaproteobacteria bacterium]|nr:4-hydroxy-tetrahydrodipicolinate synthase [Candidatus Anaeroferrophillus wilburensis]MBN2888120.1 4-hydroxy-tetrahydrodipicolinate synthase [Deltaproteobacteria bacterium]
MFAGSMVAIVTPFVDGTVDKEALRGLVEFHLQHGTDAIVPCGTTGESATLSHAEHDMVVELVVEAVNGRVPVIAGAGSNNTSEAVRLTRHAKDAGADGALLITPYYNKPTQEGLYQHFSTVASKVEIPMVLYNVPSRTSTDMLPETVARLAKIPHIVGIKEATGCMSRASDIIASCGPDFFLISGDDGTFFPLLCVGGKGVISVTANIVPDLMASLYDSFVGGDIVAARDLHYRLQKLIKTMFIETNPVPVKESLVMMGKVQAGLRLPLCPLGDANRKTLRTVLEEYGLLS